LISAYLKALMATNDEKTEYLEFTKLTDMLPDTHYGVYGKSVGGGYRGEPLLKKKVKARKANKVAKKSRKKNR